MCVRIDYRVHMQLLMSMCMTDRHVRVLFCSLCEVCVHVQSMSNHAVFMQVSVRSCLHEIEYECGEDMCVNNMWVWGWREHETVGRSGLPLTKETVSDMLVGRTQQPNTLV